MSSFTKIILIIVTSLVLQGSFIFILAEDKKPADEEPKSYEAPLIYGDDWALLSSINTPAPETPIINNNYIGLPNSQIQAGYRCTVEPGKVKLDMDGDGEYDTDLKGKENFVTYKLEYPNGVKMDYKMRIFAKVIAVGTTNYAYQRACYMTAKTPLETFTLIDDNNNGYFGDYGKDAILIGKEKQAVPLSSVIQVKDKFYGLKVETVKEIPAGSEKNKNYTGMTLKLEPYTGDTGKINLIKNLKPPKDPPSSIIIKGGEDMYFKLGAKEAVVPVGDYFLVSAVFNKRCRARSSEKPLCTVEKDKVAAPKWGGPFKLKIAPSCSQGGEVTLVTPAAKYTAPQYARQYMKCPFIKMDFPTVEGILGEEYYTPDEFKDDRGYGFPDSGVFGFKVEILPKNAPPNTNPINKLSANPYVSDWIPVDLSGLVNKSAPFMEDYRCPVEKYRGIVVVKVWANAKDFGGTIEGVEEVEVKEESK